MTIDEALLEIRKTERCWVVWSTETGEILSVSEMNARPEGKELFSSLQHLHQHQTPVRGRVLVSAKVSLQSLEQDRADIGRVKARIAVRLAKKHGVNRSMLSFLAVWRRSRRVQVKWVPLPARLV